MPPYEMLFVLAVREALRSGLTRGRDLIVDSAPVLAWRRRDPDAASGHAPAHHPTAVLRGFRAHTLLCRGSGLPLFVIVAPANAYDAPFARRLLTWAVRLYGRHPRVVRMDAAYWGLTLIRGIHTMLSAVAVVPWNPKKQKNRHRLPPTWTAAEPGKRSGIERFFGQTFRFFALQRPPVVGWTAAVRRVTLTYAATVVIALAAHHAGRPDLIRSPTRVLAHPWESANALGNGLYSGSKQGNGGSPVRVRSRAVRTWRACLRNVATLPRTRQKASAPVALRNVPEISYCTSIIRKLPSA